LEAREAELAAARTGAAALGGELEAREAELATARAGAAAAESAAASVAALGAELDARKREAAERAAEAAAAQAAEAAAATALVRCGPARADRCRERAVGPTCSQAATVMAVLVIMASTYSPIHLCQARARQLAAPEAPVPGRCQRRSRVPQVAARRELAEAAAAAAGLEAQLGDARGAADASAAAAAAAKVLLAPHCWPGRCGGAALRARAAWLHWACNVSSPCCTWALCVHQGVPWACLARARLYGRGQAPQGEPQYWAWSHVRAACISASLYVVTACAWHCCGAPTGTEGHPYFTSPLQSGCKPQADAAAARKEAAAAKKEAARLRKDARAAEAAAAGAAAAAAAEAAAAAAAAEAAHGAALEARGAELAAASAALAGREAELAQACAALAGKEVALAAAEAAQVRSFSSCQPVFDAKCCMVGQALTTTTPCDRGESGGTRVQRSWARRPACKSQTWPLAVIHLS